MLDALNLKILATMTIFYLDLGTVHKFLTLFSNYGYTFLTAFFRKVCYN